MSQLGPFFSVTAQLCLSSSTSYSIPYQTCCLGLLLTPDLPFLFQAARGQLIFIEGIDDITLNSGISSIPPFCVHEVQLTGSVSKLRGFSSLTEKHPRIKMEVKMAFYSTTKYAPKDVHTRAALQEGQWPGIVTSLWINPWLLLRKRHLLCTLFTGRKEALSLGYFLRAVDRLHVSP